MSFHVLIMSFDAKNKQTIFNLMKPNVSIYSFVPCACVHAAAIFWAQSVCTEHHARAAINPHSNPTWWNHYPHYTDKETEVHGGEGTWPKPPDSHWNESRTLLCWALSLSTPSPHKMRSADQQDDSKCTILGFTQDQLHQHLHLTMPLCHLCAHCRLRSTGLYHTVPAPVDKTSAIKTAKLY